MSSQPFALKRLTPDDVSLLRQLNALFGNAFSDCQTYGKDPPTDAYMKGLLAKDHIVASVALTGDVVMGGLVAYELDKFEKARREFYIYDLAVKECNGPINIRTGSPT